MGSPCITFGTSGDANAWLASFDQPTPSWWNPPTSSALTAFPSFSAGTQQDGSGQTLGSQPTTNSSGNAINTAIGCPPTAPPQAQSPGDPCNISSGAFWHAETDVTVPSRTSETALTFRRTYVAEAAAPAGDLGANWRHNWETRLFAGSNGSVVWVDEFGGPWIFTTGATQGTFASPAGQRATLTSDSNQYTLRKPDGVKLIFSNGSGTGAPPAGKLKQIVDAHGESITLSYNASGSLQSLSNSLGDSLAFTRDSTGRIVSMTRNPGNLTYSYAYTSDGRLASETDFAGNQTSYTYVRTQFGTFAQGMLASVTDPLGRITTMRYYDNGQLYQQTEPGSGVRTFTYSGMGTNSPLTQVTDVDGQTTAYHFNSQYLLTETDYPDASVSSQNWNSVNQLVSITDELGNTTSLTYDANGNVASVTRPDGTVTTATYDQNFNKPLSLTPPVGAPKTWTIDPNTGDVLSYSRSLALNFTYDRFGGLLSTNNGVATYSNVRDQSTGLLTQVFDSRNPETRDYDSRRRIFHRTFASGRVLTYTYDEFDRVTEVDDTSGPSIQNTYDAVGRLVSRTVTDGSNPETTQYRYDARDRLLSITDPLNHVTSFQYDIATPQGLVVLPKPVAVVDANGHRSSFQYDSRDRLIQETNAEGGTIQYQYNARGDLVALTDPLGRKTTFSYDVNGRVTSRSRPSLRTDGSGNTAAVTEVTNYSYDAAGKLVKEEKVSAASGGANAVTLFSYDSLDRLTERVMERVFPDGTMSVEDDSIFGYALQLDATILGAAQNGVEKLVFTHDLVPPFAMTGYQVTPTDPSNSLGLMQGRFTMTLDATNQVASISNGEGKVLYSETHDASGRLLTIASGNFIRPDSGALRISLSYDAFGRPTHLGSSDRTQADFQYDPVNRFTNLNWQGRELRDGINEQLGYDSAGNIIQMSREFGALSFGYNPIDELVSSQLTSNRFISPLLTRSFGYDLAGNRTADSRLGPAQFLNDQILSTTKFTFQSDADGFGNLTREINNREKQDASFTYRVDGRFKTFSKVVALGPEDVAAGNPIQTLGAEYFYDALGRRVAKKITNGKNPGFVQSYLYMGDQTNVLLAKAGNGVRTLYLDGQNPNQHLGQVNSEGVRTYRTDHLGSVLNSEVAGNVQAFGAFGENLGIAPTLTRAAPPVMYGFQGMQYDAESGMYCTLYRCYDPKVGRWTARDPIFPISGLNSYLAFKNNPFMFVDPTGLDIWYVTGGGTAVAGNGTTASGGSFGIGVGFDTTTGQFFGFTTTGTVKTANGLYIGGGVDLGYFPGSKAQFLGPGSSFTAAGGIGPDSFSGSINTCGGSKGFSSSIPILGIGFGGAAFGQSTQTNPISPDVKTPATTSSASLP